MSSVREVPRRETIVRAGVAVLGRQGYADTSLKEIAREAEVAPGLLHYYFNSKDDLLVDVVGAVETEMTTAWFRGLDTIEDPLERLVSVISSASADIAEQHGLWRVYLDLAALGLSNPAVGSRCGEMRRALVAGVEAEMRRVLGQLPAYSIAPPQDLAAVVIDALEGIMRTALANDSDPAPQVRALQVLVLSVVATAYVSAGQRPPLARLQGLLTQPTASPSAGP